MRLRRFPPLRRTLLVAGTLALLLGGLASVAHAGSYTVYSCQTPGGSPASRDGWVFTAYDYGIDRYADGCPRGAMSMWMAPGLVHPRDDVMHLQFIPPANTKVLRYQLWRSAVVASGTEYFFAPIETVGGVESWIPDGCKGTGCSGLGNPNVPFAEVNRVDRTPPGPIDSFGLYMSCGYYGSSAPDCPAVSPVAVQAALSRAEIVLSDDTPPTLPTTPVGGLIDTANVRSGAQSVSLLATDVGGGVADAAIEVDGRIVSRQTLDNHTGTCRKPYTTPVPCPLSAGGTVAFDTAALADGAHTLRVLVNDVAGNTVAWGPITITTDNTGNVCATAPQSAVDPYAIDAWFERPSKASKAKKRKRARARRGSATTISRSRTIVVGHDAATTLHGQMSLSGTPLAGAPICVVTRTHGGGGGSTTPVARVNADASGNFSVPIAAGTSRDLWAVYRSGGAGVAVHTLVTVRGRVALAPNHRRVRAGQLVTLNGRVAGSSLPSSGLLVSIQARRGRHWQTFRQTHARRGGGFRVRYRFHGLPGVHTYALRAYVPAQSDYPYAAAASRPFHVRVRG